jgi:hypothetical protein
MLNKPACECAALREQEAPASRTLYLGKVHLLLVRSTAPIDFTSAVAGVCYKLWLWWSALPYR